MEPQASNGTNCEVIVAGHSHMFAMGARTRYQGPIALLPFEGHCQPGHFLMETWKGDRSEEYWDALVNLSENRAVLITFNGNQHVADFLLAPDPLFDFVDDVDSEIHPGAVAVPRRLVKAHFAPTLVQLRTVIGRLQDSECRSIGVLGTPPPKADIIAFTNIIRRARFFTRISRERGIDLETAAITPARILLKLWRVIQDLMEETANDGGAIFLPVPKETMDAEGFLAKEFYGLTEGEITHANEQYGRFMLEFSLRRLSERLGG
jgi:hypothetical protein